ncbi:PAS domain-containing protein [Sphingomonas sp. URHD0057]|uniref:PAS domain-containing protein n=1 Tax=Sphingomonas sp. URHD0057 TaxID=1380389 RepID=UPI00048F2828|nr:PAS domain-containing protein [Sphingomonas sp. URHD0057]
MLVTTKPEEILETALDALASQADWQAVLDELPAPIYTTDTEGAVTYWNRACVDLAGREPQLGQDRWCVTWRIYSTTGERVPHDQCPMAQAIREERVIRDAVAIAERPDGSRIAFRPYPTPLFDIEGNITGAINMLVDITDEQTDVLHDQAERCRRLASALYSRESNVVLEHMAECFERTAADLKADNDS